jgi:hypothetical protein
VRGRLCSVARTTETMHKLITATILGVAIGVFPTPISHIALAEIPVVQPTLKEQMDTALPQERKELVRKSIESYAEKYNVNAQVLFRVVSCENAEFDHNLQSRIRYSRDFPVWGVTKGQRELSFGLAMIHLPSHPTISKEEATDPEFALEFMAKEVASGRASQWTCYNILY